MNNINQNTSQTALIQQTLKAQAAGAIQQDAVQITKLKEPTKVRDIQDPEEVKESHLDPLHSKDEIVVSPKNQKILKNDPQLTSPDDHPYKSHECEDNDHPKFIEQRFAPDTGIFKSLKGFFHAIIQAFSKQLPIVEQEHLEQPQPQPTSYSGKETRGQSINNFLSGWLELLPETVTGLEKFLDVEASYRQDDYQLFLQRQMVKIVKESRRAMEEQQLSMVDNNFNDAEAVAKRAIIGEALLGFTFYKISSKKKDKLDQPDDTHAREEEGAAQGLKKHQRERRIRKAKEYLKQVEKELEGALAEGADEDTYAILKKILELTSQINELSPDEVLVSS